MNWTIVRMKELAIHKVWNHWSTGKYWNRKHHTFWIVYLSDFPHSSMFSSLHWCLAHYEVPRDYVFLTLCGWEILHFAYCKSNIKISKKLPAQLGPSINQVCLTFIDQSSYVGIADRESVCCSLKILVEKFADLGYSSVGGLPIQKNCHTV